jgi:CheY-like chemotaxis protein
MLPSAEQFLANISHELRTPLHGIVGYSQLLCQTKIDNNQISYLNNINKCCLQLVELVNDILDFSKLATEKTQISMECFSMREMIDEITSVMQEKLKEKKKKIRYITSKNVPEYIISDKQKLIQILINLISNSNKFTPIEGRIIVSISSKDNNILEFLVEDDGIGISKEDQKILFHPFTQVNPKNNTKNGVGLGLAISKKLIEMLGGNISIESEVGNGSIFTFTIKHDNIENYEKNLEKDILLLKDKHVLIADSNIDSRLVIGETLFDLGIHPIICSSSKETLKMVSNKRYTFFSIIIDVSMEDYPGTKLAKEIKDLKPEIPILAITSTEIDLSNFDSVIYKPLNRMKILDSLCRIIKKSNIDSFQLNPIEDIKVTEIKILVVEDISYNLDMMVNMLNNLGYSNIETASDGDQAINKISKNTYTAMLLDLKMPTVGGLEVLEYMTKNNMKWPKVAVITASTLGSDKERCKEYGVKYFLLKPFSIGHLKSIVDKLVNGTIKL